MKSEGWSAAHELVALWESNYEKFSLFSRNKKKFDATLSLSGH